MPDYWMENAAQPKRHVLVDCGYLSDLTTQQRFARLREHLALGNFQRVGNGRLVARLPPKKIGPVLKAMPDISEGAQGYCWCTHGFRAA